MDGNASSFAIGLLILWLAGVSLFFALHPQGVAGINNPVDALKWMISEFQNAAAPVTGTCDRRILIMGAGEEYYTMAEVAEYLRVSLSMVYKLIGQGELSAVRVGRALRISGSEVGRFEHANMTNEVKAQ
jgi:excisionase family DNA binding protein